MTTDLPGTSEPFLESRWRHARVRYRPEARSWVESVLDRGETLYDAAARSASGGEALIGRAPVHLVAGAPGERWAVRHYVRGGIMGPLWRDRYPRLGKPRPFREAEASEFLRRHGVPTPPVIAAAIYPTGTVYRADLVTKYLPGTHDLAHLLFTPAASPSASRATVLRRTGELIGRIARAGAFHRDLNAKNLLIGGRQEEPELHLLDLDRCSIAARVPSRTAKRMFLRLRRSLLKWEGRTGRRVEKEEWEALIEGLQSRISASRDDLA